MLILTKNNTPEDFEQYGGGKAANMAKLSSMGLNVPHWFCISTEAYHAFVDANDGVPIRQNDETLADYALRVEKTFMNYNFPEEIKQTIARQLANEGLKGLYVAVRSSAIGEDSEDCSFAGMHSSFLFQKEMDSILHSIKMCWASGFSERALLYSQQKGMAIDNISVGVIIQKMVHAESSGVAFSRSPLSLAEANRVVINAVYGMGEGLVSGEIEGDALYVDRTTYEIEKEIAEKEEIFVKTATEGIQNVTVEERMKGSAAISDAQAIEVTEQVIALENQLGHPQDFEWAYESGELYALQTRPVTTLPSSHYYEHIDQVTLWDNSNIIESYSGVTSPLTYSFANACYEEVYRQFCQVIGVPDTLISEYDTVFKNMLGLLRGRIYYNLINWYKLVILLPGASNNKEFMETMMGVRQALTPELAAMIEFPDSAPSFSMVRKIKLYALSIYRFLRIDSIVNTFDTNFHAIYDKARKDDLTKYSLKQLVDFYHNLEKTVLKKWQAPIINDCLCMIFFGLLKKLTNKWVGSDDEGLQNDLLCGQGNIESAEPTKHLMRMAEVIDHGDEAFKEWFLQTAPEKVIDQLNYHDPNVQSMLSDFLDKYGFRCINELKLEENDLHDDPSFAIEAIASYVRTKSYDLAEMQRREQKIKSEAEKKVFFTLKGWRKVVYRYVLKNARRAIRDRENMRFARTKIFGIVRHLFRAVGAHFVKLGILNDKKDIFYLAVEEIFAYIEGRPLETDLRAIVEKRKKLFYNYERTSTPPDRFITLGPVGTAMEYPHLYLLIDDDDNEELGPNMLKGTPCSPGVVEGVVRVVRNVQDARGLNGEILVTEKTDPGWVPLYPSCSGLLIERGSLLSHSAVVARELGVPTIVGIRGGLMEKLETGMHVRMDATSGRVEIL